MKTVPLHGQKAAGRVALVDDTDFELISQYRWFFEERTIDGRRSLGPYARANVRLPGGRWVTRRMHNLITGIGNLDHADHNGLNNQRDNLRPANQSQNGGNARPRLSGASAYKGVQRFKPGRWRARICVNGRQTSLGLFASEEAAARAYDVAALAAWGEFAYLNFPQEAPDGQGA